MAWHGFVQGCDIIILLAAGKENRSLVRLQETWEAETCQIYPRTELAYGQKISAE